MSKQFFVGPTRDGSWRWYAEVDGQTVQKSRHQPTELAAIQAARTTGAAAISRHKYAHQHDGSLERLSPDPDFEDTLLSEVERDLGIKFREPWDA